MSVSDQRAITVASDDAICQMIASASRRVVVLAPAISKKVSSAIVERWGTLGGDAVSVILDVDAEVYRLGYGDADALTTLEQAASKVGTMLQRHRGVRVGVIVADDAMMVYAPTPQLVEAQPTASRDERQLQPNAVVIGAPPQTFLRDLGQGESGANDQLIGLDKAERAQIQSVQQNLKENPPQVFDIARSIRVFNAYFEFVEFALQAVSIHKKKVTIPQAISRLTGNNDLDDALQHSVRLVQSNPRISGESLEWYKARLAERYLVVLPSYGTVILRQLKDEFSEKVERLKRCVEQFGERLQEQLQCEIDKRRKQLVEQILPQITKNPPADWKRYLGSNPSADQLRQMLGHQLDAALGSAAKLIDKMQVKLLFKGITYETLNDEKFIALARKKLPGFERFHVEFAAAKGKTNEGGNT